nr:proline-rich receptor-like protein kinase PERK14 [Lolium perenne]
MLHRSSPPLPHPLPLPRLSSGRRPPAAVAAVAPEAACLSHSPHGRPLRDLSPSAPPLAQDRPAADLPWMLAGDQTAWNWRSSTRRPPTAVQKPPWPPLSVPRRHPSLLCSPPVAAPPLPCSPPAGAPPLPWPPPSAAPSLAADHRRLSAGHRPSPPLRWPPAGSQM